VLWGEFFDVVLDVGAFAEEGSEVDGGLVLGFHKVRNNKIDQIY
jgi:hypothetical protein